jgi:hypothetical protein
LLDESQKALDSLSLASSARWPFNETDDTITLHDRKHDGIRAGVFSALMFLTPRLTLDQSQDYQDGRGHGAGYAHRVSQR